MASEAHPVHSESILIDFCHTSGSGHRHNSRRFKIALRNYFFRNTSTRCSGIDQCLKLP